MTRFFRGFFRDGLLFVFGNCPIPRGANNHSPGGATGFPGSGRAALKEAPGKETLVRPFAYANGPAYGLLLDAAGASWRERLDPKTDLAATLLRHSESTIAHGKRKGDFTLQPSTAPPRRP